MQVDVTPSRPPPIRLEITNYELQIINYELLFTNYLL